MNNSLPMHHTRLHTLDSLRGLAALIVVFSHCYLALPEDVSAKLGWVRFSPLRIFVNGHASVILFFVLSGAVLALTFCDVEDPINPLGYIEFVLKRLCRIYLPFVVVISITALTYYLSVDDLPIAKGAFWLDQQWPSTASFPIELFHHIIMTGRKQDMWLDSVMWSLVYEMRISLVFPVLVFGCRYFKHPLWIAGVSFVAASIFLSIERITDYTFTQSDHFNPTLLLTLRIIPFFILGIMLANNLRGIHTYIFSLATKYRSLLWCVIFCIFCIPPTISSTTEATYGSSLSIVKMYLPHIADVLIGIASAITIVLVWEPRGKTSFLMYPINLWLGKISYSLYLVHLPVVILVFRFLLGGGALPTSLICLIAIGLSLSVAYIAYVLIEHPSKKLGYFLVKKLPAVRRV